MVKQKNLKMATLKSKSKAVKIIESNVHLFTFSPQFKKGSQ
jgi:hypothetical protein